MIITTVMFHLKIKMPENYVSNTCHKLLPVLCVLKKTPLGTRCTSEVNMWTEDPPCSSGTETPENPTPEELCMMHVKNINDFGYVCLEPNATAYLRCFLSQGVSVMMNCAPGTKCTATPGTLTTAMPCS